MFGMQGSTCIELYTLLAVQNQIVVLTNQGIIESRGNGSLYVIH